MKNPFLQNTRRICRGLLTTVLGTILLTSVSGCLLAAAGAAGAGAGYIAGQAADDDDETVIIKERDID